MTQVLLKLKMKHTSYWRRKDIREFSASFFKNTEARGVCENKNKKIKIETTTGQKFFSQRMEY